MDLAKDSQGLRAKNNEIKNNTIIYTDSPKFILTTPLEALNETSPQSRV